VTDIDSPDASGAPLAPVISIGDYRQLVEPDSSPAPAVEVHEVDAAKVTDQLLRRLGRSALSQKEAHAFLVDHELSRDEAADVVAEFVDRGYLDDAALAEQLVTKLVDRSGMSRTGLSRALAQRGIDKHVITEAVSVLDQDSEREAAQAVAERRARQLMNLPRDVAERRLTGFLMRRGYPSGMIRELVAGAFAPTTSVRFR
jgi:regulatory protein